MNVEEKIIKDYNEILKDECNYDKLLSYEQVLKLRNIANKKIKDKKYPHNIKDPLKVVLEFFEEVYPEFYGLIIKGIKDKRIIFNSDGCYVNTTNGICHLQDIKDDSAVFTIAHEFGHYIALNTNPPIISNKYKMFAEVLSIYMEKQLEKYFKDKNIYLDAINARKVNRAYVDRNMIDVIYLEYTYENKYKSSKLFLTDLDLNNILKITRLKGSNIINQLLTYPLGNMISDYLIDNNISINNDLIDNLTLINIDELLEKYKDIYTIEEMNYEKKGISRFFKTI